MAENRVKIFDTTLRDGEQSPGCSMNTAEKRRMAKQLEELGVDIIEAGFPIASEGDFDAVRQIASEAGSAVTIAALARATRLDIERAAAALETAPRPRIHVFLATSDIHLQHKLRLDRQQALEQTAESVRLARQLRRGRGIFLRGLHPDRAHLPLPVFPGGNRGRRLHPEYSRHGGLHHAPGVRPDHPGRPPGGRRRSHAERALPR